MTNNPTPTDIEKLFSVLADTVLVNEVDDEPPFRVLFTGSGVPVKRQKKLPITLGRVLAKINYEDDEIVQMKDQDGNHIDCVHKWRGIQYKIIDLWQPLGFESSLQEIVEKSGWETIIVKNRPLHKGGGFPRKQLKSPQAKALLSWLCELFISPEKA